MVSTGCGIGQMSIDEFDSMLGGLIAGYFLDYN